MVGRKRILSLGVRLPDQANIQNPLDQGLIGHVRVSSKLGQTFAQANSILDCSESEAPHRGVGKRIRTRLEKKSLSFPPLKRCLSDPMMSQILFFSYRYGKFLGWGC